MDIEELRAKYAKAYDSDFEMPEESDYDEDESDGEDSDVEDEESEGTIFLKNNPKNTGPSL